MTTRPRVEADRPTSVEAPADRQVRLGTEWRQFRLLSRDSIRRLINAAVLSRDTDPVQFAIWTMALVSTPPALYGFGQMFKYATLRRAPADVVERIVLGDRMFFVVYAMLATALLAALTWEALFPDRTDQEIIGPLPVRPRTLAAARLAAACTMAAAFSAAISLPSGVFFSFIAATNPHLGLLPMVFAAHVTALIAGSLLVFLALIVLRGVTALCLGAEMADRLATVLQLVTVIALVEVFFYLPSVLPVLVRHMLAGDADAMWLPPAWFAALYSWMVGSPRPVLAIESARALTALFIATVVVVPMYLVPARLMARRALEFQSRRRAGLLSSGARRAVATLALRPAVRGVFEFTLCSLTRNRRHLLVLVTYAGLAVAVALISLLAARLRGRLLVGEPIQYLLSVPLVMMFFLTFGLRSAFTIPTDIDANWPFRLSPPDANDAAMGTRLALLALAVCPTTGAMVLGGLLIGWPLSTTVTVAAFELLAGALLVEIALFNWAKVPFACAHAPSQQTMKSRWMLFLIPLNIFAFRGADLQLVALRSHTAVALYVAGMGLAILVARLWRRQVARELTVPFDAPDDDRLEVLNLSEALH